MKVAGHTHAFEVYTNPFTSDQNLAGTAIAEMVKHRQLNEMGGTNLLILLFLLGLFFWRLQKI